MKTKPKAIAVIPARGGSKRVPRKNIADLGGRPLVAWSIRAALESNFFARVVVSTDDPEIADVARTHGAAVPFLRQAHADDIAPVSLATAEMVDRLADDGETYDIVVQLLPTCPLRTGSDILSAVDAFLRNERTFQISVFDMAWARGWWAATIDSAGRPQPLFPKEAKMRSQDLPDLYCPTGATWVAKAAALRAEKTFYGTDHRYEPMSWLRALDIDSPEDLAMAAALVRAGLSGDAP